MRAPMLILAALVGAPLAATDYLTAEQAARSMFPQADRLAPFTVPAGSAPGFHGRLLVLAKGTQTLGHVVIDNVIGRTEQITLAVGVGPDGAVRRVEILSYRESHGQEVRLPAWRRQFEGKTSAAPLKLGKDIAGISGATLSCASVTEGVRRALALLDSARRAGQLP